MTAGPACWARAVFSPSPRIRLGPLRFCAESGCSRTSSDRPRRRRRPTCRLERERGARLHVGARSWSSTGRIPCARAVTRNGPAGLRARKLRRDRQVAGTRGQYSDRFVWCPPTGPSSGPAEFRQTLLSQRDEFVSTFTEKLLTYALGRGVVYRYAGDPQDQTGGRSGDYRWSSLILGIVKSEPFQMRRLQDSRAPTPL